MNDVLFEVVLGIVSIIMTVLTGILIPYIKEKIGNEKLVKYEYWVSTADKCA